MITNFEKYTYELTTHEKNVILPILVKVLRARKSKAEAITNKKIVFELSKLGHKTTEPRIRKIINAIRITGKVVFLLASNRGYYTSTNIEEITNYIESLMQRAEAIENIAKQVQFQLNYFNKIKV